MTELDEIFSSLGSKRSMSETSTNETIQQTKRAKTTEEKKQKKKTTKKSKNDTAKDTFDGAPQVAEKAGSTLKQRAPAVVHDMSSATTVSQPKLLSKKSLTEEDAEFADSRGKERTWGYILITGKMTTEGFRVYTEDELKLNQGGDTPHCPFDCDCCF
ncbi:hypothetical protein MVES1_000395 [Malassezia vespertilionis]|uniref:uncharacterized protein n=1 Tax=Malassezia vespertilionis TaxID=2020962 RepID=UPI0024B0EDAB|nr:uncharacterized protein MVES1_000395 [Malassezia vespertilionis]WFD05069.1 hypothetical protein MVES1_000395 [Malassezia vespertilionis]